MNRRWGVVAALVVIAGFAASGLALAMRSSAEPATVRVGGIILPIPPGFNSYAMPGSQGPGAPAASQVITNFLVPVHATIGSVLRRWDAARFKFTLVKRHNFGPALNEVALELTGYSGNEGCRFTCPPARLHLPLTASQPWSQEHLATGERGFRSGYLRFHHDLYFVLYWIGPDAPANDRAAVLDALHSIRPA